jgi:hypothetical protein
MHCVETRACLITQIFRAGAQEKLTRDADLGDKEFVYTRVSAFPHVIFGFMLFPSIPTQLRFVWG